MIDLARNEDNLDRDALNNFDVIPGCIFGRKEAEFRPGAVLNAVHFAAKVAAPVGINFDGYVLAGAADRAGSP